MTRKNYCGNLLWQSSLTLLVPEIHAYAQQNAGTGLARLEKDEVISKAKESLLSDCEIQNEKHVDNDFVQELEKRVTQMYDKCERWEAQ